MTTAPVSGTDRLIRLYHLRAQIELEIRGIEAEIRAARNAAMKVIGKRRAAVCGTDGGYHHHRRKLQEEPCDACRAAHRLAERERRARRAAS